MLAPTEGAPHRPSPLPSALLAAEPGPAVMADDPCEAAFGSADPTGARKYYRARYYDPKIGRFISADPIGFEASVNFYLYVENSPANFVDPYGLQAIPPTPQFHDWNTVRNLCGGRGHSTGCNLLTVTPSCICAPIACSGQFGVVANVSISNWRIHVATNAPRSPNRILKHELKHAAQHVANVNRGQRQASKLNQQWFNTKDECEAACALFGTRANTFMTQGHFWMDFLWQFGL